MSLGSIALSCGARSELVRATDVDATGGLLAHLGGTTSSVGAGPAHAVGGAPFAGGGGMPMSGGSVASGSSLSSGGSSSVGAAQSSGGEWNAPCSPQALSSDDELNVRGAEVVDLVVRDTNAVVAWSGSSLAMEAAGWAVRRGGPFEVVNFPLALPQASDWKASQVALTGMGDAWAFMTNIDPANPESLGARVEPDVGHSISFGLVKILDVSGSDLGHLFLLAESVDGQQHIVRFAPYESLGLVLASSERRAFLAMAVAPSGHIAVALGTDKTGGSGSTGSRPSVTLMDMNGKAYDSLSLGCFDDDLRLAWDPQENLYVAGPATCQLSGNLPQSVEPDWSKLGRSGADFDPALVEKFTTNGHFVWATQLEQSGYDAQGAELAAYPEGLLVLLSGQGLGALNQRFDLYDLDVAGQLAWARQICGRPRFVGVDRECNVFLAGGVEPRCDGVTSTVVRYPAEEPLTP